MFRPYPCVRQTDESDCGAAALATVARVHRRSIGLEKMRDLAGTDRVGTNLLGLLEAAEKLGFSARAVKGPWKALSEVPLPAIAHVTTEEGLGHFLVLHRVRKHSIVAADPARGIVRPSRKEFCERWTGYLLLLVPEKVAWYRQEGSTPPSPWSRFLALLRPQASILAEAFFCALLMTVLGLSTSFFIQHLVDSVLVHRQWSLLNALALGMLALVVFRTVFGALRGYLLVHIGRKVDLTLISSYTRHILSLPLRVFETRRIGEMLSRVNDAVKVREAVSGTTLTAVVDGTLVILSGTVMFAYDWPLAFVACAFVPALVLTTAAHHRPIKHLSRETMEKAAALQAHLVEDIAAVDTIKAYGLERSRSDESDDSLVKVLRSLFSFQMLGLSLNSWAMLIAGVAGIAVLWFGGQRVMAGALTLGQLMFFYSLLAAMLEPLQRLASVNMQVQEAFVAIDRLHQIMDLELEDFDGERKACFQGVKRAIEFRGVSFQYGCRSKVLDGVDLEIPARSTVAIVGESGSGKSTMLKLLMRFYDPVEGSITVDGLDMRDYGLRSLRSKVALVSQDPFLFAGTIADNIRIGRPQASVQEVIEAAHAAGLEEFIAKLPQRLETTVGERGANLSGGQRQRLAIARALLLRPEVLIFDEATSHLDTMTERAIQATLETALAGKTVIFVAHRLSTIQKADVIYLLHEGRVLERGSHRDLVQRDGRYAALWRSQTETLGTNGSAARLPLDAPITNGRCIDQEIDHAKG